MAPNNQETEQQGLMSLLEHLFELKDHLVRIAIALIVASVATFAFSKQILILLLRPMQRYEGQYQIQATTPTTTIGVWMKIALFSGAIVAMPFIVYQIGRFVTPGLTKRERRYLYILVPGATLCFLTGVAFAYFVMLPAALPFLGSFMADLIEQNWAIGEYLSFVTSLLFWIGVAFELPLFVYFLAKAGVIDAQTLSKNRKYAVIAIAFLSAVITPTVDPLNMALVMGPLIVLYEIGVILARIA